MMRFLYTLACAGVLFCTTTAASAEDKFALGIEVTAVRETAAEGDQQALFSDIDVRGAPGIKFEDGRSYPGDIDVAASDDDIVEVSNNGFLRLSSGELKKLKQSSLEDLIKPFKVAGADGKAFTKERDAFDPKVIFDPEAKRWVIVVLSEKKGADSILWVLVSKDQTPTTWSAYTFSPPKPDDGSTLWWDYPCIAVDQQRVAITVNLFVVGGGFYSGGLISIPKKQLYEENSISTKTWSKSLPSNMVPVTGSDDVMYIVSSGAGNKFSLSRLSRVNDQEQLTLNTAEFSITGDWEGINSNLLPQQNQDIGLDGGTDKVADCIRAKDNVWCAQTIFLPKGAPTRAAIQYFEIDTTGKLIESGLIEDSNGGTSYAYPSLGVSRGDILLGFGIFSKSSYASMGYSLRFGTSGSFGPIFTLKEGKAASLVSKDRNRWGDYSGVAASPSGAFYVANLFAADTGNWASYIAELRWHFRAKLQAVEPRVAAKRFLVDSNAPIEAKSLRPSAFSVGGKKASRAELVSPKTVAFLFDESPLVDGPFVAQLEQGAFARADGGHPVEKATESGLFDALPLLLVSTSPASETKVALPHQRVTFTFNEPLDEKLKESVVRSNIKIKQVKVSGKELTVEFEGLTKAGDVEVSLVSNELRDAHQNPGGETAPIKYSVGFYDAAYALRSYHKEPFSNEILEGYARTLRGSASQVPMLLETLFLLAEKSQKIEDYQEVVKSFAALRVASGSPGSEFVVRALISQRQGLHELQQRSGLQATSTEDELLALVAQTKELAKAYEEARSVDPLGAWSVIPLQREVRIWTHLEEELAQLMSTGGTLASTVNYLRRDAQTEIAALKAIVQEREKQMTPGSEVWAEYHKL